MATGCPVLRSGRGFGVTPGEQPNQMNLYLYVPGNGIAAYTLTAGVLGDANGDGSVDIADVNFVINIMLGKLPNSLAGDVNSDRCVDVSDVNMIINIMLGKW